MRETPPRRLRLALAALMTLIVTMAAPATAEVRGLVVNTRQALPGGDYEKLGGTVELELDPTHPANAVIVDLERAPRNARGRVEASADFMVLRPRRPSERGKAFLFSPTRDRTRTFGPVPIGRVVGRAWLSAGPASLVLDDEGPGTRRPGRSAGAGR